VIPLRDYQEEGVERVRDAMRAGRKRILLVLATGGGKTVVAAAIIARALARSSRCLFLAHRRELIKQTFAKLLYMGLPAEQVGIVMAGVPARARGALFTPLQLVNILRAQGRSDVQIANELWSTFAARRPQAPVQVASIDTARGRDLAAPDLVIIDEAHRSLSPSYLAIAQRWPGAVFLGLTATPFRSDNKGLGEFYEVLIPPTRTARQLVEQGHLVAPLMKGADPASLPDLSDLMVSGQDYDKEALGAKMADPKILTGAIDNWARWAQGLRTVVFAASVSLSREAAESFRRLGVTAEHVDGTTDPDERDAIFARHETGETIALCNYGVCTEGWDSPKTAVALMLRPTISRALARQMQGRILRPHPEKPFALILDHARVIMNHEGPLFDDDLSLEAPKKRKRVSVPAIKTCPGCFAIVSASLRRCGEKRPDGSICGFEFRGASDGPEHEEGALVDLRDVTTEEKKAAWARLCDERGEKGPGWVHVQYIKTFGVRAPKAWKVPLHWHEREENQPAVMEAWRGWYQDAWRDGRKPGFAAYRFKEVHGRWPSKPLRDEQRAWIDQQEGGAPAVVAPAAPPVVAPEAVIDAVSRWRLPTRLPSFAEVAA